MLSITYCDLFSFLNICSNWEVRVIQCAGGWQAQFSAGIKVIAYSTYFYFTFAAYFGFSVISGN